MSDEYRRWFADEGITGLEDFPEQKLLLCLTDAQRLDLKAMNSAFDFFGIQMIVIAVEYVGIHCDRKVWRVTIRQAR